MSESVDPSRGMTLTITSQRRDTAVVVRAVGEVDMDTAPQLGAAVTAALREPDVHRYVLDLTEVTFSVRLV